MDIKYWGIAVIILLLCPFACSKDTSNEEGSEFSPWKTYSAGAFSFYPSYKDQIIILASFCDSLDCITGASIASGKKIWEYTNPALSQIYYNQSIRYFGDIMILPLGSSIVFVDLKDGSTKWKYQPDLRASSEISIYKGFIYRSYLNGKSVEVHRISIENKVVEVIDSIRVRNYEHFVLIKPDLSMTDGDTSLIYACNAYNTLGKSESQVFIKKLNCDSCSTRSITIYDDWGTGSGIGIPFELSSSSVVLLAGKTLMALDISSEKTLWKKELPNGVLTSRIHICGDSILIACENEVLYCFRVEDGQELWKTGIAGTPSRLIATSESIWLIGGSDGMLYEIEKKNGELKNRWFFKDYRSKLYRPFNIFNDSFITFRDRLWWYTVEVEDLGILMTQAKTK